MKRFDCPVCRSENAVEEEAQGGFGICSVCGWEDNEVQTDDPDFPGPNHAWTLNAARKAWAEGKTLFPKYPNPTRRP